MRLTAAMAVMTLCLGAAEHRDLVFSKTPQKDLALDLYVPDGVSKPPLVVWIHGGAWRTGSKAEPPALFLITKGYAVASISYRLSQDAIFPAQIRDCKSAIGWLRAHADMYGYDASRVGVWGASAGGHLAALLGTSGGVAELEARNGSTPLSSRVHAVVDYFGPTDLPAMSKFPGKMDHDAPDSPESQLLGGPVQQKKDKAARANPITYVSRDDPPFLIVHGDADPLVPMNQSELLDAALRTAGVPVTFRRLSGAGHGGPQFETPEILDQITRFFDAHLKGSVR
ncbi:MAG TPA: alpha/beta hydrolase [Bryobacteraceae bacterium]|nr:alpha/beta hydrolase [Bryobacteraceae bacterium]